ncbi:hypothetical protein GCM10027614_05980 [Micromonospora vulcania]
MPASVTVPQKALSRREARPCPIASRYSNSTNCPPDAARAGPPASGFVAESDGQASVHLLQVQDAVTHHHRIATEYYVVLAGEERSSWTAYATRPGRCPRS